MSSAPVNLSEALAGFSEIYSPRIVGRVNDYDVRIAHTEGEHLWHVHEHTDEFFLVLEGRFDVALRDADGTERTVSLRQGDIFTVPKGIEHKPSSPGGAILMFEPNGTMTTGDRHEGDIPAHVDSTAGQALLLAVQRRHASASDRGRLWASGKLPGRFGTTGPGRNAQAQCRLRTLRPAGDKGWAPVERRPVRSM